MHWFVLVSLLRCLWWAHSTRIIVLFSQIVNFGIQFWNWILSVPSALFGCFVPPQWLYKYWHLLPMLVGPIFNFVLRAFCLELLAKGFITGHDQPTNEKEQNIGRQVKLDDARRQTNKSLDAIECTHCASFPSNYCDGWRAVVDWSAFVQTFHVQP